MPSAATRMQLEIIILSEVRKKKTNTTYHLYVESKIWHKWSCSVTQSCPTLCDPMVCSTPGFPVLHHLPEFAQTPVHWLHDAIQPSHPLWSPSPPAFNLSQHQGLFQWVSVSHQVAIVLGFSFSFSPSNEHSGLICLRISLQSNRPSRVFSNPTDPKHQFFGAQPSLWSNSYTHTWLLEKP